MSSTRVCIGCPSRDRPTDLAAAYQSMVSTSTDADMVAYVDDDQRDMYLLELDRCRINPTVEVLGGSLKIVDSQVGSRLTVMVGKRVGSIAATNLIAHYHRDPYTVYGMVPDDSYFLTPNWDRYVMRRLDTDAPHLVAAAHNHGEAVNFPFVNRAWIDIMGWYYYPNNHHHCCDTILEMVGEGANAITYADPSVFSMHHVRANIADGDKLQPDLLGFLFWCTNDRRVAVRRMRKRIAEVLGRAA